MNMQIYQELLTDYRLPNTKFKVLRQTAFIHRRINREIYDWSGASV
jgi:hypothetical protein